MHIPGDDNYWGKMLSRWVTQPGRAVYVHESVTYTEVFFAGSNMFPTNEFVRWIQAAAAEGGPTRDAGSGVVSLDAEGLYRVDHHGHRMIWVPAGAGSLKKRLLVYTHVERAGNRSMQRWLGLSGTARGRTSLVTCGT